MKKFLALFLVAFATSFFATRAMADAVVVSPNGVGIGIHHHDRDRHRGRHDLDEHSHHAERGDDAHHTN
jgi:hypothetical protein